MADTHEPPLCVMCAEAGTLRCSSCNSIHYCSKICQKTDWVFHKLVCKSFNAHMMARPSPAHYSVIYFPNHEDTPRFLWVLFTDDQTRPTTKEMEKLGFESHRTKGQDNIEVSHDQLLDHRHIQPHHFTLSLTKDPQAITKLSTVNSNRTLARIDPEISKMFWGPALAWGSYCVEDTNKSADLNLKPTDLRYAIDQIKVIYSENSDAVRMISAAATGVGIHTVRLNCQGDRKIMNKPKYESLFEMSSIMREQSQIPTPIVDRLGLPLIVLKQEPTLAWRDRNLDSHLVNISAGYLNPPHQPDGTGTLVVARRDGKPLLPTQLAALLTYTSARPKDPQVTCTRPHLFKLDGLQNVSKEDFEHWYHSEFLSLPHIDKSVPSPFAQ